MSVPRPSGQRTGARAPLRVVQPVRDLTPDEYEQLLDDLAEAEHRVDCELDARDRFGEAA